MLVRPHGTPGKTGIRVDQNGRPDCQSKYPWVSICSKFICGPGLRQLEQLVNPGRLPLGCSDEAARSGTDPSKAAYTWKQSILSPYRIGAVLVVSPGRVMRWPENGGEWQHDSTAVGNIVVVTVQGRILGPPTRISWGKCGDELFEK